jgi:hypothetical protein
MERDLHETDGYPADGRAWTAPTLTVLGTLQRSTGAETIPVTDGVTAGSVAGDDGSFS